MKSPTSNKPPLPIWPYIVFLALPTLLLVARIPGLPTADWLAEYGSLASLPADMMRRLTYILFVPFGALVVVFVRLTLGLRMLGPFRSILLAVAFQRTGVAVGGTFLLITTVAVMGLRAAIRSLHLPYFGRIMVLLSSVAVIMLLGVVVGGWLDWRPMQSVVFLPIVVLCLVADAFARTIDREGIKSALWRGAVTVAVAVILAAIVRMPQLHRALITYPELILTQIGAIIFVSRPLAFRWLDEWNPRADSTDSDANEFDQRDTLAEPQIAAAQRSKETRKHLATT